MPPVWLITRCVLYDPDGLSVFLMISNHLMRSLTFRLGLISSKFSPSWVMSTSRFAIALFRRPQLPRFLQVEKLLPFLDCNNKIKPIEKVNLINYSGQSFLWNLCCHGSHKSVPWYRALNISWSSCKIVFRLPGSREDLIAECHCVQSACCCWCWHVEQPRPRGYWCKFQGNL